MKAGSKLSHGDSNWPRIMGWFEDGTMMEVWRGPIAIREWAQMCMDFGTRWHLEMWTKRRGTDQRLAHKLKITPMFHVEQFEEMKLKQEVK